MKINVDTNRDGVVQNEPQAHKQEFTNQYGAIVLVNTDDNVTAPNGRNPMPRDSIDDQIIPNALDQAQLSQIVINKLGRNPLPANWVITLNLLAPQNEPASLSMPAAQDRIRIFYLDPTKAYPNNYVPILGRGIGATYTFPNPPVANQPDLSGCSGTITLYMEGCEYGADVFIRLTLTAAGATLGTDQVRVMPSPMVFLCNLRSVLRCWVLDDGTPVGSPTGAVRDRIKALLGAQATAYTAAQSGGGAGDQWAQDEWELSMISRPPGTGANDVWTDGVDLPRDGGLQQYEQVFMRGPVPDPNNVYGGWAEYGVTVFNSGNFGGNLEVSPPAPDSPLGQLTVGSTMNDANLLPFLKRQRLQVVKNGADWDFIELDTDWLEVGHVDEIMCYVPGNDGSQGFKVVVSDPGHAQTLLTPVPAPAANAIQSYATFFYDGTHEEAGSVTAAGGNNQIIDNTKNFPALLGNPTNYRYVRIYNGTGVGQVARIDVVATQALAPGVTNTLVVDKVWSVPDSATVWTGIVGPLGVGGRRTPAPPPSAATWGVNPAVGDLYVLVDGTKWWLDGSPSEFPAIISSLEVRNDATLWAQNVGWGADSAKGRIDATIANDLVAELGIQATDVIRLPEMYLVNEDAANLGTIEDRSGVAFNPGMSNLQPINGNLEAPKPFGPRWNLGQDLFQTDAQTLLNGAGRSSTVNDFLDDWTLYHALTGEVHCGTNVRRQPTNLEIQWWTNWDSDDTMPPPT